MHACGNSEQGDLGGSQECGEKAVGEVDRRSFFATAAMAGGLAAGYGTFAVMAGRYLYPTESGSAWMFVTPTDELAPGGSLAFTSPTGVKVVVTRKSESALDQPATESDFLALSSICPHLGCRVHWEPHNDRFFCPCHNGAFDPEGRPIAGPPKADNQHLPQYPLAVADGLLYIYMPIESVGENQDARIADAISGRTKIASSTRKEASHVTG